MKEPAARILAALGKAGDLDAVPARMADLEREFDALREPIDSRVPVPPALSVLRPRPLPGSRASV